MTGPLGVQIMIIVQMNDHESDVFACLSPDVRFLYFCVHNSHLVKVASFRFQTSPREFFFCPVPLSFPVLDWCCELSPLTVLRVASEIRKSQFFAENVIKFGRFVIFTKFPS